MFCPNCGANIPDGSKFCPNCGIQMQNQGYAQNPGFDPNAGYNSVPFKAPIQRREIALCIILSIVTCGIYGIYWYFCLVNDLNTVMGTQNEESGGRVVLWTILTCGIYGIIWLYRAGEKVDILKQRMGMPSSNSNIIYLVLALLGFSIIDYCLIQSELNKVAGM